MQVLLQSMRPDWQDSWHEPELQTYPARQVCPALNPWQSACAPQKTLLVLGSMQLPPHATSPGGQVSAHVPPEQTWPGWHWVPAFMPAQFALAPQYWVLVLGLTHDPPQSTRGAAQTDRHEPFEQTGVLPVHAAPPVQPGCTPQWLLSLRGSTQTPLQLTSPGGQLIVHEPPLHAVPLGHTVPAEPPASPTPQPAVAPQ